VGWYEDTSNANTAAAGEDWNYSITTGTGADTLTIQAVTCEFESTAGDGLCMVATGTSGVAVTDATTRFFYTSGFLVVFTRETGATGCQTEAREAFTFD
jgi:hypothetical protein